MAKNPNQPKPARRGPGEAKPRQRLNYVNIRIAEIGIELERLRAERASLRGKISAGRKPGAESGED